jgi:hypothetical protein
MTSEEKQNSTNTFDINDKNNTNTNSQSLFYNNKTKSPKNRPLYLNVLNNPFFNFQKKKIDFNFNTNSTKKNPIFPIITFNSISLNDSPNNSKLEMDALKNKIMSNKSIINKKKMELQELKIQYNKLFDENKINKNLISSILQLENMQNNGNIDLDPYAGGGAGIVNISEEQLLARINNCKIDEPQEKKLKASYELILLREKINDKKKLLLSKNKEYDKLKDNLTFKKKNEMFFKLEDIVLESEKIKKEIPKLEEILQKNNNEKIPQLQQELEKAEKNNEEVNKKERDYQKDYNDKKKN